MRASAAPAVLMDLASGAVLYEDRAGQPWYPASLTKLMTVYVALKAVRDGRIAYDAPLMVSARAASQAPSKMGFRPGTLVNLDTALKILMVKSANDVSVTVAEGVSGSVPAFADEMNAAAASLGMAQSHFVNPNGLPDPAHYSSARDLALLARALYLVFPEHADLFSIGALEINGKILTNHNNLLGRYPGVDGMKTGFTCAAGFNVVASATQGGRKLVAVVLGAPNVALRTIKAAALLDRGFIGIDRPTVPVSSLPIEPGAPQDMGAAVCRNRGQAIAAFNAENERLIAPIETAMSQAFSSTQSAFFYNVSALSRISPMATRMSLVPPPSFEPVRIRVAGFAAPAATASADGDETPAGARAYAPVDRRALGPGGAPAKRGAKASAQSRQAAEAKAKPSHHARRGASHVAAGREHGKAHAKARAKTVGKSEQTARGKVAKPAAVPSKAAEKTSTRKAPAQGKAVEKSHAAAGKGAGAASGKAEASVVQ